MPRVGLKTTSSIAAATLIFALAGNAMADDFYLQSGKIIHGVIEGETDAEYNIRTDVGSIRLSKSDVARVVRMGTSKAELDGDAAAAKGDYPTALSHYRKAAQVAEPGAPATRIQGKIEQISAGNRQAAAGAVASQFDQIRQLIGAQQYETAGTLLNKLQIQVRSEDPLTSDINKLRAQVHYGKGLAARNSQNITILRQEFEQAIAADPTFYPAYLELGEQLLGNSSTARRGTQLIEQGLLIAGHRMPPAQRASRQYILAAKFLEQGEFSKAAATYSELIPLREQLPVYADALDKAVEAYVKMGEENLTTDFRTTIANLQGALRLNPNNEKAQFLLGRIYLDLGQVENAVVTLRNLVATKPDYEEANHYLGNAYFRSHDYNKALQHLTVEIDAHPTNYLARVDRAEVHIAMKNFQSAQADLAAAKSLEPNNWYAYYLSALEAFEQKDLAGARTALAEALDRKATAIQAHLLMGRVLAEQNEKEGAQRWFQQVANSLGAIPDLSYRYRQYRAEALTYLGEQAVRENNARQAVTYLKDALAAVSDYPAALVALADASLILSNDPTADKPRDEYFKDAEKLYSRALELEPNDPTPYLQLGTYYQRYRLDKAKALENFNLYVDKGGRDARVNGYLVEVGGSTRTEIAPPPTLSTVGATTSETLVTTVTETYTTSTPGAMITTETAVMVNGTTATGPVTTEVSTPPGVPVPAPLPPGVVVPPAVPGAPPVSPMATPPPATMPQAPPPDGATTAPQ